LKHQRNLATGVQARQRCAVPRPTLEEEVEVQDEEVTACGPLATISLGSIMDTIDGTVVENPATAELGHIGETLKAAVTQFSAKLFCQVEDLKGRIPLAKATDLLRLYKQHMDCGRDYIQNRGICGDQYTANRTIPDTSESATDMKAARKRCVADAKITRTECRAALVPIVQQTRAEIRDAMSLLHKDASVLMRWTKAQAQLLKPQYDSVRDQLQGIADRYDTLGEIKSRIRSTLFEEY